MRNFKKVLVTGAGGFLGRHLLAELLKDKGLRVLALDISDKNMPAKYKKLDNFKFIACDLNNENNLRHIPGDINAVFHLASLIPYSASVTDADILNTNITGTFNLLGYIKRNCQAKRIIFTSTVSVYPLGSGKRLNENMIPAPNTVYGVSKLAGEGLVRNIFCGGRHFILRCSSIYGPGQNPSTVLPRFINKAMKNEDITIYGKGARKQNFVYVGDVARAAILCMRSRNGGIYNIASSESTSMIELAKTIADLFKSRSRIKFVKEEEGDSVEVDISKAKEILHFDRPCSLRGGLKEIYDPSY